MCIVFSSKIKLAYTALFDIDFFSANTDDQHRPASRGHYQKDPW